MKRALLLAMCIACTVTLVAETPVNFDAVSRSYEWRHGTSDGCACGTEDARCWISGKACIETGEVVPLWDNTNASYKLILQWANAGSGMGYVDWLAAQWINDPHRTYDVPAPVCVYHATFTLEPGVVGAYSTSFQEVARDVWLPMQRPSPTAMTFTIGDARDPLWWDTIVVPPFIRDDDAGFVAWPGQGSIDAPFKAGCWRAPEWVLPRGVTVKVHEVTR